MRVAMLTKVNHPFKMQEVQDPVPGPGQVLIRIAASGLCGTDIHIWRGEYRLPLPLVLGHEPVGTIEGLGPGVKSLRNGDRVGVSWTQGGCGRCISCREVEPKYCETAITWVANGGGNADLMLAEATGCTLLPEGLEWTTAAPLLCAGFTVMSGYRNAAPRPGDRVAVLGMGGLGHLALQVAKARGHEVIAVTSTPDKRPELLALGADAVLVGADHVGKALWEQGGVDVILSTSNAMDQNSRALHGLRPEGRFVSMAVGQEPIAVPPTLLLTRQLVVQGSMQNHRRDLVEILDLAATGAVRPRVETYAFDEINTALRRLADRQVRFRAVIEMPRAS